MDRYNEVVMRSYEGEPLIVEWGGEERGGRDGVAEIVCGRDGMPLPVLREGGGAGRPYAFFRVQPGRTVLVHAERRADEERAVASVIDAIGPHARLALRTVAALAGEGPYDGPAWPPRRGSGDVALAVAARGVGPCPHRHTGGT